MFRNYYQFIHDLQQALQEELEAASYYQALLDLAPGPDRADIQHIREDEEEHARTLSRLYLDLTGRPPVTFPVETTELPSYLEGLRQAAGDQLKAVEQYRNLYLSTFNSGIRDRIFAIMVDEQEHATRLTLLYGINKGA